MITILNNKRVVLGVTGSIAAYKAADLASKLTQAGADVDVVMTEAALAFISPLTFEALTGRPVYHNMWERSGSGLPTHIAHVGLAERADLIVVAPATANTLAKIAHGFSDDLLSVTLLAARCPVMVAPAMDGGMYEHPATQANVRLLEERGLIVVQPDYGRFASGLEGRGRLPDTPTLMGQMRRVLGMNGLLKKRHVVVTAGGTREALDPVRFLTNASTGKQGYAIAQAAIDAGATVTLISTVTNLPLPHGVEFLHAQTAAQLEETVTAYADCDALIMAAAVADFRPKTSAEQKIKKEEAASTLELERTVDVLQKIGHLRKETQRPRVLVGFAAETSNLIENAQSKLTRKNADMIVANDLTAPGAGFAQDTNAVTFITHGNPPETMGLTSKTHVAEEIVWRVASRLKDSVEPQER